MERGMDMKKYRPSMGKANVVEGETLLFPFRTLSNEISKIIGEVVSFDKTSDGLEYIEVNVGDKRIKRYVI
ncbi:hypothetical protein [Bacillus thuringiensis]|uniref:Uncharacterized protein n=3 Tax=Bacillus cereus group TaxID=86661 RepID=A0A9X7FZV6_BACTU|nr:hypothetical protein [Bacillus thuringiensis]MBG9831868.1 hypothetical protein [Bacillus wiedmannii]PEV03686.1 hypothetical protein CN407_24660 [Bacillus cereus]CCW05994.1 hypothetical protein EBGED10_27230 [Bacillus sp. GeD10]MBG9485890.1 hypothetical protein [Bacillus thuringiensis]MBG9494292.1 hypothetical protein [Bacillus thuringiensis]